MPTSSRLHRVPPSPDVMAALYMDYTRDGKPVGLTFAQYLHAIGYNDPSAQIDGMDDGLVRSGADGTGPELISVPTKPINGTLRLIVLLVDFADQVGTRSPQQFSDLLFSEETFPTGSLRDYYRQVSGGRVHVEGTVHGWFRLPQPYSFYTNNESGMGRSPSDDSYPHNARRMAEDAVAAALAGGVTFDPELDKLGDGTVTALFIVHAGRGAEELAPAIRKKHIWSHKWELRTPADVAGAGQPALQATRYLTVPEDCNMGVCAHELGHLAFQWEDFYDPNGTAEGQWAGSGNWDLMAGGSWNGNRGDTPAHPVGFHKLNHGWVTSQHLEATSATVTIPPSDPTGGSVVIVRGPGYTASQSLFLENRQLVGFDRRLPGAGLLVWRVDLDKEQGGPTRPALQLVQADGRGDLDTSFGGNQGDAGDPFPGRATQTSVDDTPGVRLTTSFSDVRSGITLSNITLDPVSHAITFSLTVAAASPGATPMVAAGASPPPSDLAVLGLDRLFKQEKVTTSELQRYLDDATPSVIDIERRAQNALLAPGVEAGINATPFPVIKAKTGKTAKSTRGKLPKATAHRLEEAALASSPADDFGSLLWRAYKWANSVTWDREGQFFGVLDVGTQLVLVGDRDYLYTPHATDPFGYETADGTRITPGKMVTDGGSTPRIAWLIRDLDPWTYLKAYLIHDWEFLIHHCRPQVSRTFEAVNHSLAEGIYTLMMAGEVTPDWRKVAVVHSGVESPVGQRVWKKQWDVPTCKDAMPQ